jgi:hypothetical protein
MEVTSMFDYMPICWELFDYIYIYSQFEVARFTSHQVHNFTIMACTSNFLFSLG